MKLRIKGNMVRLRLTQSEVARLRDAGQVIESTEFPGGPLRYSVAVGDAAAPFAADFRDGRIEVRLPLAEVRQWADSAEEGLYGRAGAVDIAVEKDFQCLHQPGGGDEAEAFPNPAASRG